jgi:hypothetical protein
MPILNIHIADDDYERVINALSWSDEETPGTATEEKAMQTILSFIDKRVVDFDKHEFVNGFIHTPPEVSAPEQWVQPTGAHDAYQADAIVMHSGSVWRNTHGNGNVWEPGAAGIGSNIWEVI